MKINLNQSEISIKSQHLEMEKIRKTYFWMISIPQFNRRKQNKKAKTFSNRKILESGSMNNQSSLQHCQILIKMKRRKSLNLKMNKITTVEISRCKIINTQIKVLENFKHKNKTIGTNQMKIKLLSRSIWTLLIQQMMLPKKRELIQISKAKSQNSNKIRNKAFQKSSSNLTNNWWKSMMKFQIEKAIKKGNNLHLK